MYRMTFTILCENACTVRVHKLSSRNVSCGPQHLNEILAGRFDAGDDVDGLMATSDETLLPVLSRMKTSGHADDDTAIEEIGNRWCAFLGQELSSA